MSTPYQAYPSPPPQADGSAPADDLDAALGPIDLTASRGIPHQRLPAVKRYWRTRTVRRNKTAPNTEQYNEMLEERRRLAWTQQQPAHDNDDKFTYISGPRYIFQRFIRQYPVGALSVWVFLFLVELAMVVLYIVQSTVSVDVTWVKYDTREHSRWLYAQFILSLVSLMQLFFAYSLSLLTISVVVSTSIYQIVIFFVSLAPHLAWVSRMYVPFFLRCWPMRQYFLFILDSIALMATRNQKLDLLRLGAGTLTLFVCMVFTAAGVYRIEETFQGIPVNIGVAIYFAVVTVTTVGFGDVTPQTPYGKAVVLVIIFVFIAKMPTFIQVIRSTVKILRAFRSYKGRRNHFLVYGRVTREEAVSILDEVFCLYPMKTVCFCNKEFDAEVLSIARHPTYRLRATFLIVETLDSLALRRMKAEHAAAVVILPIAEGYSSRVDDDVMLSSLIFERLVPELPQYVWLRYGLHAKLLKGQRAAIIDEHMKKNIMATALLLPGIVPFLVNLVRSAWAEGKEAPNLWQDEGVENWEGLYEYSRRNVISTCSVPARFVKCSLRSVITRFKYADVLIVGVEESARKTMRLDLDYVVEENDVLMAVYERGRNSLAKALETFAQTGALDQNNNDSSTNNGQHYGTHFRVGMDNPQLMQENINASFVFYPYNSSADVASLSHMEHDESDIEDTSADDVKRDLANLPFVDKHPSGVPLSELDLGSRNAYRLSYLMKRHEGALADPYSTDTERHALVSNLEAQINTTLSKMAQEHIAFAAERDREHINANENNNDDNSNNNNNNNDNADENNNNNNITNPQPGTEEVFLFVDQTTSIMRKNKVSVYEDIISQTIAQYELYVMMQCIRSVHLHSRLSLLTLRKYPPEFLKTWNDIFGVPIRYIRGQGSLDSHLNYALSSEVNASKIRRVLLYCSQMGPRDFGDVPIFSVENSVRELLEWNERAKEGMEALPEQNIMVELQSFTSSIKVSPFHSNPTWRRRGEINFQDSLAFMMGRCFSSNMLQPLMVHSHRDTRIASFFEMVLSLSSTAELFDISQWSAKPTQSQTLFKLCGNHSLQFQTFGDAFEFLMSRKNCVAIGVFRLFPESENLNGSPRFFVTNPPLAMPLLMEDIIYCLDGGPGGGGGGQSL